MAGRVLPDFGLAPPHQYHGCGVFATVGELCSIAGSASADAVPDMSMRWARDSQEESAPQPCARAAAWNATRWFPKKASTASRGCSMKGW
jgi:hypothetical protein